MPKFLNYCGMVSWRWYQYTAETGMGILCPLTSKIKGYNMEITYIGKRVSGVFLAGHIKSLDFRKRPVEYIETVPTEILDTIIERMRLLIPLSYE